MATLAQILNTFAALVGSNVNDLRNKIGDPALLDTTAKDNLVAALNEVRASLASGSAVINDAITAADSTYSSQKIEFAITTAINNLKGSAPIAYDTLQEIAAYIEANESAGTALLSAMANRLRYDQTQLLTAEQIQNVYTTLELGLKSDIENLVATYIAARDAVVTPPPPPTMPVGSTDFDFDLYGQPSTGSSDFVF